MPASSSLDHPVLTVLHETVRAIRGALEHLDDWGLAGTVAGQHFSDLAADEVALAVLDAAGFGVMSEESGEYRLDRDVVVVLDPVDGSTNASRGIPWFAASLCALDAEGPLASVVVNLASGTCFEAVRGAGAYCDGRRLAPSGCERLGDAVLGLSGFPRRYFGWKQFRALGAAALDLCCVASGVLDGYVDCSVDAHGSWDYLGGLLVCREAGAVIDDAFGRELVVRAHDARRTPVAAATPSLLASLVAARRDLQ